MTTRFGIFAKYWTPGRVKTRLAAAVGDDRAAELHRAFLETLLGRFETVGDERVLFCSPPDTLEAFAEAVTPGWHLATQSAGDLGQRMRNFFDRGFADGCDRIVLIGSDSPDLPATMIEAAFQRLRSVPVVLGPAEDGGYTLIGASGKTPPVFDGIAWGGSNVLRDTIDRLQHAGVEHHLLPEWSDVDRIEDLRQLATSLASSAAMDKPLQQLQRTVNRILKAVEE